MKPHRLMALRLNSTLHLLPSPAAQEPFPAAELHPQVDRIGFLSQALAVWIKKTRTCMYTPINMIFLVMFYGHRPLGLSCCVIVIFCLPRPARVMAARWIECIESGRLFSARTNWKLRIPPISPQIQHAENRIIWGPQKGRDRERIVHVNANGKIDIRSAKL